jgi:hypothetical protein
MCVPSMDGFTNTLAYPFTCLNFASMCIYIYIYIYTDMHVHDVCVGYIHRRITRACARDGDGGIVGARTCASEAVQPHARP